MASQKIIPLILCGGSGSRLWPLSQPDKPKQFMSFGGEHSLFQQTVMRAQSATFNSTPIVVTSERLEHEVRSQIDAIGVAADVVLEPTPKDSAAAVLVGAMLAHQNTENALVLAMASDHQIPDNLGFCASAQSATTLADMGFLVAFGAQPSAPISSFGYIVTGSSLPINGAARIKRFVEKPAIDDAKKLIAEGCLWNTGNFLFRTEALFNEFQHWQPQLFATAARAFMSAVVADKTVRPDRTFWADQEAIAFDRAIMEKTANGAVCAIDYAWNDVGSWDAVARDAMPDQNGNVIIGNATISGGKNVFVHAAHRKTAVVGCDDLIVVVTNDAVLVTRKGHSELVRAAAKEISGTF